MIAKFEAYDTFKEGLKLLLDCLISRNHHVKIGSSYSMWSDIRRGVPQGPILGLLFFNVFLNNLLMFIKKTEIFNFADYNTFCSYGKEFHIIMNNLNHNISIILKWFKVSEYLLWSLVVSF